MIPGYTIVVQPDPRRYGKLPADVQVTPEFRAEFDAWAADFFRPAPDLNPLLDDEYIVIGNTVRMNPRAFEALKKAFP
jgi:hypothetical protein